METGEEKIDFEEKENIKSPQKANWFVWFLLIFANFYFSGFLGKNLITGEKFENRFLRFIDNIFWLIIESLPVALFVLYFLITVPTGLFFLAIVSITFSLFSLVSATDETRNYLANQKEQKNEQKKEEEAKNYAKYYEYNGKYYKNRPTTLIGDFFRYIGTVYFAFLFGTNFIHGIKIERSKVAKLNIIEITFMLHFWTFVISCFLIPVPTWLFVLAVVAGISRFAHIFCLVHVYMSTTTIEKIFFCKCQGQDKVHASPIQVEEKYQTDVPACLESIDNSEVKCCNDLN